MSGSTQLISGVYASDHSQIVAGTVHGPVYFGRNEGEHAQQVMATVPQGADQ
jgi:hypothetical protein